MIPLIAPACVSRHIPTPARSTGSIHFKVGEQVHRSWSKNVSGKLDDPHAVMTPHRLVCMCLLCFIPASFWAWRTSLLSPGRLPHPRKMTVRNCARNFPTTLIFNSTVHCRHQRSRYSSTRISLTAWPEDDYEFWFHFGEAIFIYHSRFDLSASALFVHLWATKLIYARC